MKTSKLNVNKNEEVTLITHNGVFHADEIIATYILKTLYPNSKVIRTRDKNTLSSTKNSIVYDVGLGLFDHHQQQKELRSNGIPYAAAGLIWREFGSEFIAKKVSVGKEISIDDAYTLLKNIDKNIIESIDALDNGFDIGLNQTKVSVLSLSQIVSLFNYNWDDEGYQGEFLQALELVSNIFEKEFKRELSKIKALKVVREAFNNRSQKEIVNLKGFVPWQEHLLNIDKKEEVLFVTFPQNNEYRIQTVPVEIGSFNARKLLPINWAGKTSVELNKLIGIDDAVFVHPGRFIAGTQSFESIQKIAKIAIENI